MRYIKIRFGESILMLKFIIGDTHECYSSSNSIETPDAFFHRITGRLDTNLMTFVRSKMFNIGILKLVIWIKLPFTLNPWQLCAICISKNNNDMRKLKSQPWWVTQWLFTNVYEMSCIQCCSTEDMHDCSGYTHPQEYPSNKSPSNCFLATSLVLLLQHELVGMMMSSEWVYTKMARYLQEAPMVRLSCMDLHTLIVRVSIHIAYDIFSTHALMIVLPIVSELIPTSESELLFTHALWIGCKLVCYLRYGPFISFWLVSICLVSYRSHISLKIVSMYLLRYLPCIV